MKFQSETVAVQLTPPGRGAVATVLVAGPHATSLVDDLFHSATGRSLADRPLDRILFGRWQDANANAGEEIVACRRAVDQVELHCHGGSAASMAIIAALLERGCRQQSWQERTEATANDPTIAEAQAALARASTLRIAAILLDQQAGALGRAVADITRLIQAGELATAVQAIDALLRFAPLGLHLAEPWRVVLAGRPNAGKSSLINALVGYERAIVHATPGTTRDVVTAAAAIAGWPIELADTAGLRGGAQPLEAAGIELARQRLGSADLIVLVLDASVERTPDDGALLVDWPAALVVLNKSDLLAADSQGSPVSAEWLPVSALRGDGLEAFQQAIAARLVPDVPPPGQAIPFLPSHCEALQAARQALQAGHLDAALEAVASFIRRSQNC